MPSIYEYVCEETGETAELIVESMADAPAIGHVRMHEGKRFVRVPSTWTKPVIPSYAFISHQVEDDHPDAPHKLPDGTAAFSSKREVAEFCAKTQGNPRRNLAFHMDGRK